MYKIILTLITAVVLTSCGSGGGSTSAVETINGNVADGYLNGANVCFDVNASKTCDGEEQIVRSGENGAFTLNKLTKEYPILVEVLPETIDEDTKEAIGTNTYVLSAPAGKTFISPITTMIQGKIEDNPTLSADNAAKLVKQDLGAGDDISEDTLFEDYASSERKNSKSHKTIYQTAQIIARVMGEIEKQLTDKFKDLSLDLNADMKELIQKQVKKRVKSIAKTIFTAAKKEINEDTNSTATTRAKRATELAKSQTATVIKGISSLTATVVKRAKKNIAQEKTNKKYNKTSTAVDFLAQEKLFFGSAEIQTPGGTATFKVFLEVIEKYFLYNTDDSPISTATFAIDYKGREKEAVITKFKERSDITTRTITTNTDGSVNIIFGNGTRIKISKIAEKSIDGLTLGCSEMVNDEDDGRVHCEKDKFKDITATFTTGDKQYFFTFEEFGRFGSTPEKAIKQITGMSWKDLCNNQISSQGSNDDNHLCSAVHKFDDIFKSLSTPTSEVFSSVEYNINGNKISYFFSTDGKSVEACKYAGTNIKTCAGKRVKIGDIYKTTHTYKSKEVPVFIYPVLDDGDFNKVEYKVLTQHDGDTVRVNAEIEDEGIQSYTPFNWSAYQKIFDAFNPK